jgi:uncharacterized Zn finger protein
MTAKEHAAMGKEDELRELLNETARRIAETQSNPRAWRSWLVYLLERLEQEATNSSSAYADAFTDMLSALQDALRNRARTGGW